MRTTFTLRSFTLFAAIFAAATAVSGQAPLLVDNFDYPAGALLVDNGWAAHSGAGTNSVAAVSPGLVFSNYPGSGVGNAAGLTVTGEDVHRTFAAQSSGSVYAAVMVNISDAATDALGGYFFHLGPDPIGTTFRGRIFARKDASNNLSFGLSKAGATEATIAFTGFTYSLNTTYLLVLKYTVVEGLTNDTVELFINPALPGGEPATPTLTAIDVTAADSILGSVALRQGSATTSPTLRADGVRIGTSWASVTSMSAGSSQNVVDFDGDGKTDFAVVRNTGGGAGGQITWFINYNGTTNFIGVEWGINGDNFVPVDFDGDNKTDIAVWRGGAAGVAGFYILQSSDSTFRFELFGQQGDNPRVAADYDGDGKADPAVYRAGPTTGTQSTWYYRGSLNNPSGNITFFPWGINGDFPAPGDYDGDGKNDFVVQRNNGDGQARFWMNLTTDGFKTVVYGTPTDVIVPGDYDGDGKTDVAVVRAVSGQFQWFVIPSSTGTVSAQPFSYFGDSTTDRLAQGDYDGDGKTDPAIWRPGTGTFWYSGMTSGVRAIRWGSSGDYPVANYNTF
ncbi:hypothetical protein BH24ACI3_BH24ACI3_12380 [soil metagenome]